MQALKTDIFSGPSATVFAILDGASVPDLLPRVSSYNPEHACLYRGHLEPDMAEVAPYLAILEPDSPFTEWVLGKGWGGHWGIIGSTEAALPELRRHFRRFVTVSDENGKLLYFRFYDPRVLRIYLPSCNADELKAFFGPVTCYLVEDKEPGDVRRFRIAEGVLREERTSI